MGILDRFQGFGGALKNIGSNPLAMAGLGLLSMPTQSRQPINPMEYAMNGIQMGQDQQDRQTRARQLEQELGMRTREYGIKIEEHDRARAQREQLKTFVDNSTDQNLKQVFAIGGEAAAAKYMTDQYERKEPIKLGNSLLDPRTYQPLATVPGNDPAAIQTYRLTHPQDATLQGFDTWNRSNRASGATQVNLGKPMSITDALRVKMPDGSPVPLGMPPEDAIAQGATLISPAEQAAANKAATWSAMTKQQAVRTRDSIQRLEDFIRQQTPASMLNPAARGTYKSLANSAANEIAKSRGTPGAEPSVPGQNAALSSIPSLEDITVGALTKGDIVGGKLQALQLEFADKDQGEQTADGLGAARKASGGNKPASEMTDEELADEHAKLTGRPR